MPFLCHLSWYLKNLGVLFQKIPRLVYSRGFKFRIWTYYCFEVIAIASLLLLMIGCHNFRKWIETSALLERHYARLLRRKPSHCTSYLRQILAGIRQFFSCFPLKGICFDSYLLILPFKFLFWFPLDLWRIRFFSSLFGICAARWTLDFWRFSLHRTMLHFHFGGTWLPIPAPHKVHLP